MTVPDPIPDDVLRFLDANVDSVEQLELLRIVGERPTQAWDVSELIAKAQATPGSISVLELRGLLKTEPIGSTTVCRFAELLPEMEILLNRLLQLYKERPVTLIRLIYSRGRAELKAFAEAFRLRKEN